MVQIVELYSDEDLTRLRARVKTWIIALSLIGTAGLAACIVMAASAGTATAERLEQITILTSTVAGWVVLYGVIFVVTAGIRELRHARMLRDEERIRQEGTPSLTKERVRIKSSITARRVKLSGAEGSPRILVCDSRSKVLNNPKIKALYTVHGYVAAYEVEA